MKKTKRQNKTKFINLELLLPLATHFFMKHKVYIRNRMGLISPEYRCHVCARK